MNKHALFLRPWLALAIVAGVLPAARPVAQAPDAARYRTYDEMTAALRALQQSHGNLVKLADIGKSHEGRTLWAVEIASGAGVPADARPALLVAANFEGDQLIGGELALHLARHLAPRAAARRRP